MSLVTPKIHRQLLLKLQKLVTRCAVSSRLSDVESLVSSADGTTPHRANFSVQSGGSCTCGGPDYYAFPCAHQLAAIEERGNSADEFIAATAPQYLTTTWREQYPEFLSFYIPGDPEIDAMPQEKAFQFEDEVEIVIKRMLTHQAIVEATGGGWNVILLASQPEPSISGRHKRV